MLDFNVDVEIRANITYEQDLDIFRLYSDWYADFNPSVLLFKVETTDWVSNKHNMGMALKREVWQKIKKCSDVSVRDLSLKCSS